MQIRDAAPEDLETVRQLLATCELPHEDLTPRHLEHFLVGREHGEIAGVVGLELHGKAALLRSLAVSPQHRSSGVGACLIEAIEKRARRAGAETLYLLTTSASNYFRRHRYENMRRENLPKAIQETEEAARLCPARAICMTKPLAVSTGKPEAV